MPASANSGSAAEPIRGGTRLGHSARSRLLLALVLALACVVYLPTLGASVLNWDDPEYVTLPWYDAPDALARIWTGFETPQVYPLVFTSFWLERRLWGEATLGYHLDQMLLHLLATWLCWRFLRRLGVSEMLALAVSALFALHPTQVSTVAWLAERKNLLMAVFSFAGLLSYLDWRSQGGAGRSARTLVLLLAALCSKTTAVTLPLTLFWLEWLGLAGTPPGGSSTPPQSGGRSAHAPRPGPIRRSRWTAPALCLIPALLMGVLTVIREHGPTVATDVGLFDRIAIAALGAWHNLLRWLVPVSLSPVYPRWVVSDVRPVALLALVGVIVGVVLLWRRAGRIRRAESPSSGEQWAVFGFGQYLLALPPTSGVIPFGYMDHSFIADHFLYWPAWGFWLGLFGLAAALAPRLTPLRGWSSWLPLLWVVPSLVLTPLQARHYHDSGTFWRSVLAQNPNAWIAHANHGQHLAATGQFAAAEESLLRALAIAPDHPDALFNLGYVYDRQGRWSLAVQSYEACLKLDPSRDDARNNLVRVRTLQARSHPPR